MDAFWPEEAALRKRGRLLGRFWLRSSWASDTGCDCFFLLFGGKCGSGECCALSGLPSYPVASGTVARGSWGPVVTRQSTEASGMNFTFFIAMLIALCALENVVHYFLYILVSGSHCFCVWVLPEEYRELDSVGNSVWR